MQTRRYVDLVTINVFRVGDDPAAAQADAENDAMIIRLILAALGHALLYLDRTARGIDRCTEFSQNAVPRGFDKPRAVLDDFRINQLVAMGFVTKIGSFFIQARQCSRFQCLLRCCCVDRQVVSSFEVQAT